MYLRPHLSRALSLSLFRPDLFHSPFTPLCTPVPRALHVPRRSPSFLSFPLVMLTLVALTIPRSLSQPLSPSLAPSRSLPRRASARRFFSPPSVRTSFFFLNTPPSRRVIFIICYLLRQHTTGRGRHRCRRVSGTAHPEKPENRGKQKRPARRAAHPAEWCAWMAVAVTGMVRESGEGGR